MNHWKSFFVLAALVVFSQQVASAASIKMGYFTLPPHQYTDDGKPEAKGASISYFNEVASKMGHEVEWTGPLPLLRLFEYLKTGELDGTVGFNKFPEMEPFLYYPDSYLYLAQPTFIVRKDKPLTRIQSIEDIRGYRVGLNVSISGRYTPLIDEYRDMITIEGLGGTKWIEQNIRKLIAGRVDACFDRQPYSMLFVVAAMNLEEQIKVLSIPDSPTPMYVVFSKNSKMGKAVFERYNIIAPGMGLDYLELLQKEIDAVAR